MRRLSGKNFSVNFAESLIQVISASLSITDNSAVVQTSGVPDGHVDGDCMASGEIVVNRQNFKQIIAEAKKAGSFRAMPTFDLDFYASVDKDEMKVEAFGCLIKLSDLLDIDTKGGDVMQFKIPYEVTSPDFVTIDGVPYLRPDEVENIVQ